MSMMQGAGPAMDPSALLAAIGGTGGAPAAPDYSQQDQSQGEDWLSVLQDVMQGLHRLQEAPDPRLTAVASKCQTALAGEQDRLMSAQHAATNPQQQLAQQLGGGQ